MLLELNVTTAMNGFPFGIFGLSSNMSNCSPEITMPSTAATYYVAMASDGLYLFVWGGRVAGSQEATDETYRYDLTTGAWTQKTSMRHARFAHSAIQIREDEYLISGNYTNTMQQVCYMYNLK